jgi:metal-responsive CopG/Arc/MetJ family transcriptional regulator
MARVSLNLEDHHIAALDELAAQQNCTRSDVLRSCLMGSNELTPHKFNRAAAAVQHAFGGFLSRDQATHITAVALNSLHQS